MNIFFRFQNLKVKLQPTPVTDESEGQTNKNKTCPIILSQRHINVTGKKKSNIIQTNKIQQYLLYRIQKPRMKLQPLVS